jgi:hypothetical protein
MNLARVGGIIERFAAARLKWIQALACITFGWLACFVWVLIVIYAPQIALSLIHKVS